MSDFSDCIPRKLTFAEASEEQLRYWRTKTPAERLAASTALTKRSYAMLGIDLDERKTDLTPRRVSRRRDAKAISNIEAGIPTDDRKN